MDNRITPESIEWMRRHVDNRGEEARIEILTYGGANYSLTNIYFEMRSGSPAGAYFSGLTQRMLDARRATPLPGTSSGASG